MKTQHGLYEPTPKHGASARGSVSAEPSSVATFEKSLLVKDPGKNNASRVAYDPKTKEFINYRQDTTVGGEKIWHGYATSDWKVLRPEQRNALIRAGVVKPNGRPINP